MRVIEQMAMKCPVSGIVAIEGNDDLFARRNQHGVTPCTIQAFTSDLDDLICMPVQVHRLRHAGTVRHDQLDPFA